MFPSLEDLTINKKTVSNHLTGLKRLQRVENAGGRWRAIPDVPDTIVSGIRESRDDANVKPQDHAEDLMAIAA